MSRQMKGYIGLLSLVVLLFLYGITLYPHSPLVPTGGSLEAPNSIHYLGTDDLGIDIFAQLSRGFYMSMFIGVLTALLAFFVGGGLGILGGYKGGKFDAGVDFLINLFLSIPQLPIMIVIGAFFGQSLFNIILIIAAFSWAPIAKIVRAKTLSIKKKDYIKLAKSYGGSSLYIIKTHILREILPLAIINGMTVIGKAIISESSLAFLGLSDPTSKSWGMMINHAINFKGIYFTPYWVWWLLPAVLCLMLTIFVLRLIAKELEKTWIIIKEG